MPFYLTPEQDDFNKIPELQVCIAEALYDADAVLSNPSAFKDTTDQTTNVSTNNSTIFPSLRMVTPLIYAC